MDKRFASHTAEMIVATAQASCPGDPVGTAMAALALAHEVPLPCVIALASPHGDEPAGPDYPPDLETADEAATELAEIEES